MPINQQQVENQIKSWEDLALFLVRTLVRAESVSEHDAVVGQNWINLGTAGNFPDIVDTDGTDTVILFGTRKTYSKTSVRNCERAVKLLLAVLEADTVDASSLDPTDQVVKVTGTPIKDLRAMLTSGLA